MKVLMQSRKNFFTLKGGDTVQLLKTKNELEKLGVEVDISLDYAPDLSDYDLVHISNLTRIQETYMHVMNAVKQKKPIVLSTIYWPMEEFEKNGQVGIRKMVNKCMSLDNEERIKALARLIKDKNSRDKATMNLLKVGYTKMQKYVIDNVDYFMPNSEMEMEMLRKHLHVKNDRYSVIPNAIDDEVAIRQYKSEVPIKFEQYKDSIICVGRIEPRKNQLALVQALDGLNYKLVLVGEVSNNQKGYFAEIKKYIEKNENFYYIPRIENDELYQLYKVCKVSVLPSWLDTPGLVSLEAGAMGCSLAVSTKGSTTEYFNKYAEYCEPDDVTSIRSAVDRAYAKDRSDDLRKIIMSNYTWKIAAKKTLECYRKVVKEGGTL